MAAAASASSAALWNLIEDLLVVDRRGASLSATAVLYEKDASAEETPHDSTGGDDEMTRALMVSASLALLLAGVGAPVAAQVDFRETVDVRIVNVDLWVTDRDGNPVRGLGASDFEVLEDGEPVPISHFVELSDGAPRRPAEGAETSLGGSVSHLIVFLDRSSMQPASYARVLSGLRELLAGQALEPERVLLLEQNEGLAIVSPLGSTREDLLATLDTLAAEATLETGLDHEAQQAVDAVRATWEQSRTTGGGTLTDTLSGVPGAGGGATGGGLPRDVVGSQRSDVGMGPDACRTFHSQIQPMLDAWARRRAQRVAFTLSNLSQITTSLAGLEGEKTLLYLGDGMETQPGADLAAYASSLCSGPGGSLLSSVQSQAMGAAFHNLTLHAASNRVTIYAIETAGLHSGGGRAGGANRSAAAVGDHRAWKAFESARRSGEREGMLLLAEETGGRGLLDLSGLERELDAILSESKNHYSLAYVPATGEPGGDSGDHEIEVRAKDRSFTTRYRRGYVEKDSATRMTEKLLGALNLGIADNPLAVRLGAGEMSGLEGGGYRFPLMIVVPVEQLVFVGAEEKLVAEVEVVVMARHLDTGSVVRREQTYRLEGTAERSGTASLPIVVDLEGGVYLTAVGIRDRASGEASFVSTTLQVGEG
jgi:VWFA-related protein